MLLSVYIGAGGTATVQEYGSWGRTGWPRGRRGQRNYVLCTV